MVNFEESKTKKNLEKALQGEALAHLKYQFYRSKMADINKNYEKIFDEIVHNEKEHGKIWFKLLHNNGIPDERLNLLDAITGELYECQTMYREFAEVAEKEGFEEISTLFNEVANIECGHASVFENMAENLDSNAMFSDEEEVIWKCSNCGYVCLQSGAPEECPVCRHPQKYFAKY